MQAQIYAVPIGAMGNEIVTTIEIYIPEMDLIVGPGSSSVQEDAKDRYEQLKCIGEFEIEKVHEDMVLALEELKEKLVEAETKEEEVLTLLDDSIREVVNAFQAVPQIQIATSSEMSQILGSSQFPDDDDNSRIIFEG